MTVLMNHQQKHQDKKLFILNSLCYKGTVKHFGLTNISKHAVTLEKSCGERSVVHWTCEQDEMQERNVWRLCTIEGMSNSEAT